jgi:hypothetical protein
MNYKWKPSASQRRAFAERMKDPDEQKAYNIRKAEKKEKFYDSLKSPGTGANYVPTKAQHDFCVFNRKGIETPEQEDAANQICFGYSCNEKVDHFYIHIINEIIRKNG